MRKLLIYLCFSFIGACLGLYFLNVEDVIFNILVYLSLSLTLFFQFHIDSNPSIRKKQEQEKKIREKMREKMRKEMLEFGQTLIDLGFKSEGGKLKIDDTYYSKQIEEKTISFREDNRRFTCFWDKDRVHYKVSSDYVQNVEELKIQYEKMRKYIKRISYK